MMKQLIIVFLIFTSYGVKAQLQAGKFSLGAGMNLNGSIFGVQGQRNIDAWYNISKHWSIGSELSGVLRPYYTEFSFSPGVRYYFPIPSAKWKPFVGLSLPFSLKRATYYNDNWHAGLTIQNNLGVNYFITEHLALEAGVRFQPFQYAGRFTNLNHLYITPQFGVRYFLK